MQKTLKITMTLRVPVEQTPGDVAHKLMDCAERECDYNVLEVATTIKQNMRALKRKGTPHVAQENKPHVA